MNLSLPRPFDFDFDTDYQPKVEVMHNERAISFFDQIFLNCFRDNLSIAPNSGRSSVPCLPPTFKEEISWSETALKEGLRAGTRLLLRRVYFQNVAAAFFLRPNAFGL